MTPRVPASLVVHVGHVLSMSPKPEVAEAWPSNPVDDVDTRIIMSCAPWGVAGVADIEAIRNGRSARNLPCGSVSLQGMPTMSGLTDYPIPMRVFLASPSPAATLLDDSRKIAVTSVAVLDGFKYSGALSGARHPLTLPQYRRGQRERLAACRAEHRDALRVHARLRAVLCALHMARLDVKANSTARANHWRRRRITTGHRTISGSQGAFSPCSKRTSAPFANPNRHASSISHDDPTVDKIAPRLTQRLREAVRSIR